MKPLKVAKNVKDCCLVHLRGDKVVLPGKSQKVIGAWYSRSRIHKFVVICLDGVKRTYSVELPPGIQTYGEAMIKAGEPK